MLVFLDFEASSLGKHGYPIEVGWVFEDGSSEAHLIRPAPGWDDWDAGAEAIHHISRAMLAAEGTAHEVVAQRMVAVLAGHDLLASAPSWDGKWLSALLRAAGLPRHTLRLRDTEEAQGDTARAILAPLLEPPALDQAVEDVLTLVEVRREGPPRHRALADAEDERARWCMVRDAAEARAEDLRAAQSAAQ
ncbi:transcriptional regulator [Sphingomonas sp.]|uniref:3'-5' exonuclease n=1 Tax=Sphingomonas sp. TaxID=28214 RepID=UPI0035B11016